jgi:hypothetical protein
MIVLNGKAKITIQKFRLKPLGYGVILLGGESIITDSNQKIIQIGGGGFIIKEIDRPFSKLRKIIINDINKYGEHKYECLVKLKSIE